MTSNDYYTLNENNQLIFHYSKDNNNISINLTDLYNKYDKLNNIESYSSESFGIYSFYLSNSKIILFEYLLDIIL